MAKIKSALLIDNKVRKMNPDELQRRIDMENKLKGESNKLQPPSYLTERAKEVFMFITTELEESGVLANLDIFLISQTAIALSDFEKYELMKQTTTDPDEMIKLMKVQDMLVKQNKQNFADLCLSPTSRARLANMAQAKQQEQEDPLVKALKKLKESRNATE